jgi:hypothetical protein
MLSGDIGSTYCRSFYFPGGCLAGAKYETGYFGGGRYEGNV